MLELRHFACRLGLGRFWGTRRLKGQQTAGNHGLADQLALDIGLALQSPSRAAEGQNIDLDAQLIARGDGAAEARALDAGENQQLVIALGDFGEEKGGASLGHSLDDQNARHNRIAREVPHEKRFVDRNVLDGNDAFGAHQLKYAIDQQQRITMRQNLENSTDVEFFGNGIGLIAHCGIVKSKIIHIVDGEIVIPSRAKIGRVKEAGAIMRKTVHQQFDTRELIGWLKRRQAEMIAVVREMVLRESPTHDKPACDALCADLAGKFEQLGGEIRLHRQRKAGDHLQADFAGPRKRAPILLLGHFDTVYDLGTLERMPWREMKGRLSGPGVFDMKSGIAQMMFAIKALQEAGGGLPRPVKVLLVSDEEEGSATSRAITERVAKQCAAVLVCEPSGPGGALKTARKGVGSFTLKVTGRASHAGLDFEKGHSAIVELAHQIHAISRLTDLKRGVTLNVGIVRGGTRTNVVAAEASAEVDLRIAGKEDGARMERKVFGLRPENPKCQLEISGGINRPPLERTKQVAALFEMARGIGREIGFKLDEVAVGGGSDGNFTAGLGIPTLDGLGGVGDGAHASHEYVIAAELPRRAALLAGLIQAIP